MHDFLLPKALKPEFKNQKKDHVTFWWPPSIECHVLFEWPLKEVNSLLLRFKEEQTSQCLIVFITLNSTSRHAIYEDRWDSMTCIIFVHLDLSYLNLMYDEATFLGPIYSTQFIYYKSLSYTYTFELEMSIHSV